MTLSFSRGISASFFSKCGLGALTILLVSLASCEKGRPTSITNEDPARLERDTLVVESHMKAISVALVMYQVATGRLPTTEQGLAALVTMPTKPPIPDRWRQCMEEAFKDPWNHEYRYRYPAQKSKKRPYDLWSMGPDGQDNTVDDIGNWQKDGSTK